MVLALAAAGRCTMLRGSASSGRRSTSWRWGRRLTRSIGWGTPTRNCSTQPHTRGIMSRTPTRAEVLSPIWANPSLVVRLLGAPHVHICAGTLIRIRDTFHWFPEYALMVISAQCNGATLCVRVWPPRGEMGAPTRALVRNTRACTCGHTPRSSHARIAANARNTMTADCGAQGGCCARNRKPGLRVEEVCTAPPL